MEVRRFAGVLAWHGDRVVLVRESHAAWGGEFWNVPSGGVEDERDPVLGAVRELAEETGLVVAAADCDGPRPPTTLLLIPRSPDSRPTPPPPPVHGHVGLRSSVEPDTAVGGVLDEVAVVVDAVVVPGAEQHPVLQVGAASAAPGVAGVVGLAPGRGDRAALGAAAGLGDGEGLALRGGEEPSGAAEVEHLRLPAEDGGDDAGAAGEPAYLTGAGAGAVAEGADAGLRGEARRRGSSPPRWWRCRRAGAAGRGRRLRAARRTPGRGVGPRAPAARPPRPPRAPGAQPQCRGVVPSPAGCGEGFQVGLQPRRRGFRDPGPQVDGPVATHVQGEPGRGGRPAFGRQQRACVLGRRTARGRSLPGSAHPGRAAPAA